MDADVRLVSGRYTAVVSPVGAALLELTFDARPLVVPAERGDGGAVPLPHFSGVVLAPWPNRLRDGRWSHDGQVQQLPLTEPGRGTALHGLLTWVSWTVVSAGPDTAVLATTVNAQPGYPFTVDVTVRYALSAAGLQVTVGATNRSPGPAPFGTSIHPYLVPGTLTGSMAEWTLEAPVGSVVEVDPERLLPRAVHPVDGTGFDLRDGIALDGVVLDHAFGAHRLDGRGTARAVVTGPDGFGSVVSWDAGCPWLQVCTADAAPGRWQRCGVAVEPMTCPPDAFNSGTDLWHLERGQVREVTIGLGAAAAG